MKGKLREKIFYTTSILLFTIGIVSTLLVIHKTVDTLAFINRGHRSYKQLSGLLEQHKKNEALLELLETAAKTATPPFSALIEPYPFETQPDIRERDTQPVYPPYILREVEVVFKNAPLKDVAAVINAAENLPIPWMLSEFHATATGVEPGVGNVITILRTITQQNTETTF